MAYITGTATDHVDLWDTLLNFLQNNADLVAAGQAWTVEWSDVADNEYLLKGPGFSGTDEIFVGLKRVDQQFYPDESQIYITGATGMLPGATAYHEHVNTIDRRPSIFLSDTTMEYWFVANGRRFIAVVKVSSTYQALYGGWFLPYATPGEYPYPMFIGGTRGYDQGSNDFVDSWRNEMSGGYRHFVYPHSYYSTSANFYDTTAFLLEPGGTWRAGTYIYNGAPHAYERFLLGPRGFPAYLGQHQAKATQTPGFRDSGTSLHTGAGLGYATVREHFLPGLDGEFSLTPVTLMAANHSTSPEPVTYGILDGVYSVSGGSMAAENIITFEGVNHLVIENVSRTEPDEYWALALE